LFEKYVWYEPEEVIRAYYIIKIYEKVNKLQNKGYILTMSSVRVSLSTVSSRHTATADGRYKHIKGFPKLEIYQF
jgi:hypothetical protein